MGEVILFPGTEEITSYVTLDDENVLDSEVVLTGAISANLKDIIVVGRSVEDDSFYFASTSNNAGKLTMLLELAKKILVDAVE